MTDSISLPAAQTVADSPPDWAAVADSIVCPLCEYDLRGLTEPRCPECGYQFQWRDLTDPKRRCHPYIFEHHPRRNFWSFTRTAIGGMRPWKFWSSLRPDQSSRPKRLVVYWGAAMLVVLLLLVLDCAALFVGETARYNKYRRFPVAASTMPAFGSSYRFPVPRRRSYLNWYAFRHSLMRDSSPFWVCWAGCVLWPWLTLAILMIFRVSMRRAKVKTQHVLRSVLYSGDAFLWPALLLTASLWMGVALMAAGLINDADGPWLRMAGSVVAIACFLPAAKLWAAYQRYLRFPHALWTVVASQVILFLAVPAAIDSVQRYLLN